jgi:hypothetical protein
MVWAGICHDVRTQLIIVQGTLNAVKYRDDGEHVYVLQSSSHKCSIGDRSSDNAGQGKTQM